VTVVGKIVRDDVANSIGRIRIIASTAAIAATAILFGLALFQAALVAGKPLGHLAWGDKHRVLPMRLRVGSALSVAVYVAIAAVLLDRADLISVMHDDTARIAAWVIAAYFVIGIGMNAASRSKPERYLMTPIVLLLAVLSVITAAGWG
jgi:hypothetical protein